MKALIVDDSHIAQLFLKKILEKLGFEVISASNGLQGLKCLSHEFSIIMVDWQMPCMDGYDFIKTVRSNSLYHHIPIIMVTSESTDSAHMANIQQTGVNALCDKPFEPDEVRSILARLLDRD